MANQTQLTDNNSDNVSFVLTANTLADNPGAPNNDPSTFNIRFNGTPNNYLNELGIYDAYCLQPWIPITNGTYPAEAYYSTENFTIDTFADIDNDGNINELFELTQDSLQASVFTLNNLTWEDLDSDGDLEGIISDGQGGTLASGLEILDIQLLIWYQLYGLYAPDFPEFDETPYGDRTLDQASNESLAMSIEALATNYVPEKAGDQVGVILIPTDINPSNPDPNGGGSQYLLTTIELSGLGDYVWFDTDEDGIQDLDEKGIEGVTVQLLADLDDNGQIDIEEVLKTTTTDANGFYSFDGIVADDYQVRLIAPDNLDFTQTNAGGNDNSDSDVNSNGLSQIINLTPGEFKENIDAGLVVASELELACLGNYVFIDNNNNGIQDRSDTPLSGVTVELLTANGELVDSTTTNTNGFYFFNSLIPGNYQVKFIAPQGFNFTTVNVGNDNLDSDADSDGLTAIITLTSGQNNFSVDAGLVSENLQPGIEIEKFTNGVDADTPEEAVEIVPGQPVTWTYQVTNTGNTILTLDDILVTDDNGTAKNTSDDFSTDNGLIILDVSSDDGHDGILSAHETWIYTASGIAQNLTTPTLGSSSPIAIYKNIGTVNIEGATDSDASHYVNPELACLGNYVFIDNNNNGIQDRSDTPLSGVTVELLTANGELVDSTTTNTNGFYFFNSLIPGNYQVKFIAPQGFNFTTVNVGNDNLDSDADSDGLTAIITLTSGQNNFSVDAGLVSENLQPGIEIEKFTNGVDADTPEEAVEIVPGQPVTWTYQVTNTGNTILTLDDILVTDDNGTAKNTSDDFSTDNGLIILDVSSDDGHDGILSAHETWIYTASGIAQNLTTPTLGSSSPIAIYKNIGTVNIEGATDSDASHYVNPEVEPAPEGDMAEILGRPQALTFTYIPGNTVQTSGKDKDKDGFGDQDGKAKIESGFPDHDGSAYIVVANKKELDKIQKGDAETYFAGNVEVGQYFIASVDFLNGKNVFDDNTYILVLENEAAFLAGNDPLQVMKYRTKDDQPIEVGDVIGSVQVVEYFGEIGSYDNTHIEAITGEINRGFQLNEILGKPLALTFEYNNGDTLFTNQKDKDAKILVNNRIDDDGTSYIIVTDEDKANDALAGKGQEYFAGYVSFNSVFEASVTNAATDKFENKTYIHYFDDITGGLLRSVQYKAKGDKDIHLGDDLSGLEIVGYVGEDGSTGIVL